MFEHHYESLCCNAEPRTGETESGDKNMTPFFSHGSVQGAESLADGSSDEIKSEPWNEREGGEVDAIRGRIDNADDVMLEKCCRVIVGCPGDDGDPVE